MRFKYFFFSIFFFLSLNFSASAYEADSLEDTILALQALAGETATGIALLDDINSDNKTGMAEALHALKVILEKEKTPSLVLMIAQGTDTIKMAWIPGSDGQTPAEQIQYKIYLSTSQNFTPTPANLKKTVTGVSQTEVTDLTVDTLYFGKIVAEYSASASEPTLELQTKTHKYSVVINASAVYNEAADLGLGKHTTTDGIIYTYSGGTPPAVGSILFSEDVSGGFTMRTIDSVSSSGGTVTVHTSSADLTEVIDRGSIYSSFRLVDVSTSAKTSAQKNSKIASTTKSTLENGCKFSRMVWDNRLLIAEQTDYSYNEDNFTLQPKSQGSLMVLKDASSSSEFTVEVSAGFDPQFITDLEWGSDYWGQLDSAHVAAIGTLSLSALAQYKFTASGSVSQDFELYSRDWISLYWLGGPVWVFQQITLSVDITCIRICFHGNYCRGQSAPVGNCRGWCQV